MLRRLALVIQPLAASLGAPGLALVSFVDSSFLSLPEATDLLIIVLVLQHQARWLLYGVAATAGSVAGCYALFLVGRRGGEAFLRRKFRQHHLDRGLAIFRRHGMLAIAVPAILPPPAPFKIFVLLAGIANVRSSTFLAAVAAGRGFRYVGIAWLALVYGNRATEFIRTNLANVSIGLAAAVALAGATVILWRRRRAA